jgi:YVTN family beta-propeller protein
MEADEDSQAGAVMRRFRQVLVVVVLGVAGALVGVIPDEVSAVPARARCRPTAFVTNGVSGTVSTIGDIAVGSSPQGVAVTPDGKTVFVVNGVSDSVSTIDVKTRRKNPTDIGVGDRPDAVAVTPDGKTAFVTNRLNNTVSTIDVKTRRKNPADIAVGGLPWKVAVTTDSKTAYVTNNASGTVSSIDVKSRTKLTDIPVGAHPKGVAVTPDGKTVFVGNANLVGDYVDPGGSVSVIDVKTGAKDAVDIPVSAAAFAVAFTPDDKTAFVTHGLRTTVSTIDVRTKTTNPTDITVRGVPNRGGNHTGRQDCLRHQRAYQRGLDD